MQSGAGSLFVLCFLSPGGDFSSQTSSPLGERIEVRGSKLANLFPEVVHKRLAKLPKSIG
jgi:hypothetical protein